MHVSKFMLWRSEAGNATSETRPSKKYFVFWHLYTRAGVNLWAMAWQAANSDLYTMLDQRRRRWADIV